MPEPSIEAAIALMIHFAERTWLASERPRQRYLWTDAFAVCNFLGLARITGEERYTNLSLRLIEQVHHTLGRHRGDDTRTGWISGLDDFGTGYSSFSYLQQFDIDYIKIDQTFVRNLTPGSNDLALCEAIIVMAHKLDMKVVAEGVETTMQRNLLRAAGCDYGQGYLFSKPLPAAEFESLLAENAKQNMAFNNTGTAI